MRLTYDKTHKTLSLIAVTVLLTLNLTSIASTVSSVLMNLPNIGYGYYSWGRGIVSLLSLSTYLFSAGVVLALIWRKKNVLTGLAFALPLVYTLLVWPVFSVVIYPLLLDNSQDVVDGVLDVLQNFVFSVPMILFYVAIMLSCFTKGKLFGEKAGVVLLILGGLTYLNAVTRPVTGYFVNSVVSSIRHAESLYIDDLIQDFLRYSPINFNVLLTASPTLLIALAYSRPNKEPVAPEEETENNENTEENAQ